MKNILVLFTFIASISLFPTSFSYAIDCFANSTNIDGVCYCNSGFQFNINNGQCSKIWIAPSGYVLISGPGSIKNYSKIIKEPNSNKLWGVLNKNVTRTINDIKCQKNSTLINGVCSCNSGYKLSTNNQCINNNEVPDNYYLISGPSYIKYFKNIKKDLVNNNLWGELKNVNDSKKLKLVSRNSYKNKDLDFEDLPYTHKANIVVNNNNETIDRTYKVQGFTFYNTFSVSDYLANKQTLQSAYQFINKYTDLSAFYKDDPANIVFAKSLYDLKNNHKDEFNLLDAVVETAFDSAPYDDNELASKREYIRRTSDVLYDKFADCEDYSIMANGIFYRLEKDFNMGMISKNVFVSYEKYKVGTQELQRHMIGGAIFTDKFEKENKDMLSSYKYMEYDGYKIYLFDATSYLKFGMLDDNFSEDKVNNVFIYDIN